MKIHLKKTSGNVMFATLLTTGIISIYMGSYLSLIRSENDTTRRSQTWNMAIPIAEAGIEEALTHLQSTFPSIKASDGWVHYSDGEYILKTRQLNEDARYVVGIFPPSYENGTTTPTIVSEGFARIPGTTNFVSRIVQVNTRADGFTLPGLVVVKTASMNGNKLVIDSFNSTNSAFSTNGKYDENKRGDKALLATLSSDKDALSLGNSDVWGKVASGPNGSEPNMGPQSVVGDATWHNGKKKGLQPGAYSDDMNMVVEPPKAPFTSALMPTALNEVTILNSGDYAIENLTGSVVVSGKARLLVTKKLDLSTLTISNSTGTASLELYVAAESAKMGKDVNVQGRASNFKYFGLPPNPALNWEGNKTLQAGGNGQFTAIVYAPLTDITLNGGGNKAEDFSGACLANSIVMKGHYSFHYDESISGELQNGFVAISWDEIRTDWNTIQKKKLNLKQLTTIEYAAR